MQAIVGCRLFFTTYQLLQFVKLMMASNGTYIDRNSLFKHWLYCCKKMESFYFKGTSEELFKFPVESSPDPCAICLEKHKDKSFPNNCIHEFCFSCLLLWSKVINKRNWSFWAYELTFSKLCSDKAWVPTLCPTFSLNHSQYKIRPWVWWTEYWNCESR